MASPNFVANCGTVTGAQHGTTGATARKYKVVCVAEDGTEAAASAEVTIADGNATLSETDHIAVSWDAVPGCTSVKVYRTSGGETQGLIATVLAGTTTVNDPGLVATTETPPTADTSGLGTALAIHGDTTKMVQFTGTFTATIQMQGSLDGSSWVNEGSAATAVGGLEITKAWNYLRTKMTAYTSGTPVVLYDAVNR